MKITYSNWSQDLFGNENEDDPTPGPPSIPQTSLGKVGKGLAFLHSVGHLNQQSKRETFVPYLLKNNTGLPLSFAMMTSLPSVAVKIGTDSSTDTAAYLSPTGNVKGHSLLVTSLDDTSEWREIPNGGEAAFDFKQSRKAVRQRRVSGINGVVCVMNVLRKRLPLGFSHHPLWQNVAMEKEMAYSEVWFIQQ